MRTRVDLTLKQFRGGADGNLRYLPAQALARTSGIEHDLLLRRGYEPGAFRRRGAFRLLDQIVRAMLRLVDDVAGALARFANDDFGSLLGLVQVFLAALSGRQAVRDGLLPRRDCTQQRRPDEAERKPDQDDEDDRLTDQGRVDFHCKSSRPL